MHYVYILHSSLLDRFYIGQTANLEQRMREHASGRARFTSQASDWRLVFLEVVQDRRSAMRMERSLKRAKSRATVLRYVADARNQVGFAPPLAIPTQTNFVSRVTRQD